MRDLNKTNERRAAEWNAKLQRAKGLERLLDGFLTVAAGKPSEPVPPLPRNAELREFEGLKIAFPHTEGVVDTLANELRQIQLFPAKHEQLLALALSGRGGTMIDIGANIGLTVIPPLVLGLVDTVIAVEPASTMLPFLEWNLAANGLSRHVTVVAAAVGDVEGTVALTLSKAIGLHRIKGADGSDAVGVESVREIVLDQLVRSSGLRESAPRFVKIDTQGAEARILRGGRELLSRRAALFEVEFWPSGIEALGDDPREVLDAVEAHFAWFMDQKSPAGELLPIAKLREAMGALGPGRHTDLLLLP